MKTWQDLTDMLGAGDIESEMSKKYKGTLLKIKHKEKTFHAYYLGYDGNFKFKDFNGVDINLSINTDIQVTIPAPQKGLYNTPSGVVHLQRSPYRQYKRGLCADNCN